MLTPGDLFNMGTLVNAKGANIYACGADEAIIPITPTAEAPTVVTKRIKFDSPFVGSIMNFGTIENEGAIMPGWVAINDNGSLGELVSPGKFSNLFAFDTEMGTVTGSGTIWQATELHEGWNDPAGDGTWCYVRGGIKLTNAWVEDKGWYYLDGNGNMATGWVHSGSEGGQAVWYYLSDGSHGAKGRMVVGWAFVDGTWYYFNEGGYAAHYGQMARSRTVPGGVVGADGKWVG